MIKDIKELNFPSYATLSQATCTLQDMAEKTITTQVKIDGEITPDFTYDWEIGFKGEKYIMPLRQPQAAKENTSLNSTIDLTFQHWAQYQLKRWYFFTIQPVESGTPVADKYIASVSLNLKDFCALFNQILDYYFNGAITIDLNTEWEFAEEPTTVEISYSYLWDVLIQFYELWAVRWQIEPNGSTDKYVIKVGYPVAEVDHIFEYGFKGGLLKVERQVQDDNIRNMLLGRGGEKNLPYRYFKDIDPDNPSFPADPDWIPELRNIYFSELRGATFRSYIQGWKAKHYKGTTKKEQAYAPWAWELGYTDEKFNPVEYVKDDISIAKYGELMGGLENNEEIYPSIQGVVVDPYGRVDEVVDVEPITSDDIEDYVEKESSFTSHEAGGTAMSVPPSSYKEITNPRVKFTVDSGQHANIDADINIVFVSMYVNGYTLKELDAALITEPPTYTINVYDATTGEERSAVGIPAGDYYYEIVIRVKNTTLDKTVNITTHGEINILSSTIDKDQWTNTWDIWVKNIWGTEKKPGETDTQYVERVWRPILGDREGNEAKVVFSTGMLSTSEDYEFVIAKGGIHFDTSKTLNGVPSHWRLTLGKSDADLESTGLYLPSTMRQGKPGDHFFFVGIDMPHQYVVWAEERLDDYKTDNLDEVKDIKPTWVVSLDKVRINNQQQGELQPLISQLHVGDSLRLADKRFIINDEGNATAYEILYLQSITYTYNEPSSSSPALIPDIEVVLSDKYETIANPVATLSGEVKALSKQVGAMSNVEQIVRAIGDKLYLRKDGIADRSMSPTEFFSLVNGRNFRSGIVGGASWGIYQDANGNWIVEADKFKARQDFEVNNLVINQIIARGGMIIESAAQIEITSVSETAEGYVCYFDQKMGSVANLFHVDDVAYCNRFTSENTELKFYKRRVVAIADNSITLTKGYDPVQLPDGTTDTGINGTGIPDKGDVIVQYGNYTDSDRRYAKIYDVIGGGYERYLEGLDSVNASGKEYYFVGKHDEQNPRWFIGYRDRNYAEWRDGNLYIKGNIDMTAGSSLTDVEDFKNLEDKVDNIQIGGRNLLTNTKGFTDDWRGDGILQPGTYQGFNVYYQDGSTTTSYWEIRYQTIVIMPATEYTLSFYAKGSGELRTFVFPNTDATILATNGDPKFIGQLRGDGRCEYPLTSEWKRYFVTFRTTDNPTKIDPAGTKKTILFRVVTGPNEAYICGAKLEKGNVATDWSPAPEDSDSGLSFIKQIFPDGLIDNKATISQLLAVKDSTDANANIVAGIYGGGVKTLEDSGFKDQAHGKLMFFAGAENIDKVSQANTRIYEDGTLITNKLIATNANITGYIIAEQGMIGNYRINDAGWLYAYDESGGSILFMTDLFMMYGKHTIHENRIAISDISGYLAISPKPTTADYVGLQIISKFNDYHPKNPNIGIYLSLTDTSSNPRDNHALYIEHGNICGFRLRARHITGTETISTMDSVILCWNANLTLPADAEDGQIYFLKQMNNGAVTVNVGATGHYINDGRTNKKTSWTLNSGIIVIFIWDAVNLTWHAGYTNCN